MNTAIHVNVVALTCTVGTVFHALHNWPDAPAPVAFLRYPHRHAFHVSLTLPQEHGDRAIEFILAKEQLIAACNGFLSRYGVLEGECVVPNIGSLSCEQIALTLLATLRSKFTECAWWSCSVSEDNENGATVTEYADVKG